MREGMLAGLGTRSARHGTARGGGCGGLARLAALLAGTGQASSE